MNAKLLFKIVFTIVMLFLLVLVGLGNKQTVAFALPPILAKPVQQPAAIMYFACFAVGVLAGAVLSAGGGKKGAASAGSPPRGAR
jgi:uncharacterized integral membrane protein